MKKKTINFIAKNLLSKYNGNLEKASFALKKLFLTKPELVEEYKNEIFGRAAFAIVQSIFAANRSSLFKTVPTLSKGTSGEAQQANVAKRVALSIINETEILLDMALNICKKQLRFATKEDLAQEINMFIAHARGNDSRATFLSMIYEGLEENKSVETCFTEKDLSEIMEKTQKSINREWSKKFIKVEEPIEV